MGVTAQELLEPEISGNTADPEGDGFSNMEEYVLARNPRTRDDSLAETARGLGADGRSWERLLGPFAFLLESAPAGGETWARYTFLGTEPRALRVAGRGPDHVEHGFERVAE